MPLSLGFVPDIHFAVLHLADKIGIIARGDDELKCTEFVGGTGELAKALAEKKVDVAIGLTDGLVTSICNGAECKIIATFVDSSMKWQVFVSPTSGLSSVDQLRGKIFGITRHGGGSHINAVLLAKEQKWNIEKDLIVRAEGTLEAMIKHLETAGIDAFVMEPLFVSHLVKEGKLQPIQNLFPPWPCFMIAATDEYINREQQSIVKLLSSLQKAAAIFHKEKNLSINQVREKYGLSENDAASWFSSVRYSPNGTISREVIERVISTLLDAGTIKMKSNPEEIVVKVFANVT